MRHNLGGIGSASSIFERTYHETLVDEKMLRLVAACRASAVDTGPCGDGLTAP